MTNKQRKKRKHLAHKQKMDAQKRLLKLELFYGDDFSDDSDTELDEDTVKQFMEGDKLAEVAEVAGMNEEETRNGLEELLKMGIFKS